MTKPNDTGLYGVSLQVVGTELCFGVPPMSYTKLLKIMLNRGKHTEKFVETHTHL